LPLGLRQRSAGQRDVLTRMPHLFRRDGAGGHQGLALRQIGLGTRQLQSACHDQRVVLIGRQFFLPDLAHRLTQRAGTARQCRLRIDRIQSHEHLPRRHELRVVGEHGDDGPGHL